MALQRKRRLLAVLCSATALVLGACRCRPESPPAAKPALTPDAAAGVLEITVSRLRNQEGQVLVAVYKTKDGFPSDAAQAYLRARSPLAGESALFRFEAVPYGTYAVSALHDENGNGVIDKSFFGIPQEGAGASNNPKPRFGPPRFETATFSVKDRLCTIDVKIQYP